MKDGKKDKDKDAKKKRHKLHTFDPYLLLSFVYFDQTHCGYIFDKDIEELIYTLGLNLSRAQVRKLVQKVVTRDSLHYRKLTDKVKEEDVKDSKDAKKDDADKVDETSIKEDDEEVLKSLALGKYFKLFMSGKMVSPINEDFQLFLGNKKLLPVFVGSGPVSKRARKENSSSEVGETESVSEGFIMYKGSLLDIEKLVSQLKRSESARVDTEARMMEIQHELSAVSEKSIKQSNTIKDLSDDLKVYKDRLRNNDDKLKKVTVSIM